MNREEKSKASRTKIIQSAFTLFAEKGYDATSTQDIIENTGLSRGAMYHHFKSKEDILKHVTHEMQAETDQFLADLAADQTLTVQEKLSKLFAFSSGNQYKKQMAQFCWVEKVPFALLEDIRHLDQTVAPYIAQILEQGIQKGEFKCEYPLELAELLVICTDVWLSPVINRRTHQQICRRLDFLMVLLDGMKLPIVSKDDIQQMKDLYLKAGDF